MKSVDDEFAARLRAAPDQSIAVIITATGNVDDLVAALPTDIEVCRVFRMRPGVAAKGLPAALLRLAAAPEVARIEPDRTVSAQGGAD